MIPVAATGIGSMPGGSVAEATAVVAGEVPEWPYLPELPARGAGADMIGRTAALLIAVSSDFACETVPTGWCRTGVVGPDMRRARSWLGEDLDRLEQVFGSSPGVMKVQVCGPWTWSASVEGRGGRRLLEDEGFVADLAEALTDAIRAHVADVKRRLPGRSVIVQIDEPALAAVALGSIPSPSGWGALPPVPVGRVAATLQQVRSEVPAPTVLHSCAGLPLAVARDAGFEAVSWDASGGWDQGGADQVAETVESGVRLLAGLVAAPDEAADAVWERLQQSWGRTGLGRASLQHLSVTPTCGLAGSTPSAARRILAVCREVQRRIDDAD